MGAPDALPALPAPRCWTSGARSALDPVRAREQWIAVRDTVAELAGPVLVLDSAPWSCASVFVRDLGVTVGDHVISLRPRAPRGLIEPPLFTRALRSAGVAVVELDRSGHDDTECGDARAPGAEAPGDEMAERRRTRKPRGIALDGGNVIADAHGRLLVGLEGDPPVEMRRSVDALKRHTGLPAIGVPIGGGRWPHLDMALADLGGRCWLAHPPALPGFSRSDGAWRRLFAGRPVVCVDDHDGERLGCNVIVVGDAVIGPPVATATRRSVARAGLEWIPVEVDELVKAGGGVHCATLDLPAPGTSATGGNPASTIAAPTAIPSPGTVIVDEAPFRALAAADEGRASAAGARRTTRRRWP